MEHAELIKELSHIEKLTNQERLKLAHSRRKLQLKNWNQHEKLLNNNNNPTRKFKNSQQQKIIEEERQREAEKRARATKNKNRRIRFKNAIMLLEAAGRNDVVEVRRLLEEGVDPDVANEDGLTALHQCCIDDNEDMMKLLVESGANVNAEDSERWTPLHAAATCGHLHLVKYLIAKGANLLAVNAEGNMPYDICDEEQTLDYIESEMAKRGVTQELIEEIRALPETRMLQDMQRILAQGGDLEFRDKDGATYLHIAAANGYLQVVEFLLDNHVATDVQDKDCWQPIHAAACWGHVDVLELLVQNGADLNARTKNNETPYAICEDPEIKERIMQLRSEQETKLRQGGVPKIRRSVSSNSRTQSIRRTSQRDKGLTSKKDAADEAAMLLTINLNQDNNSPSPTTDIGQGDMGPTNKPSVDVTDSLPPPSCDPEHDHQSSLTSEEDIDIKKLPPHILYGRDSITQLHLDASPLRKLRHTNSVESNGHGHGDTSPSSPTKNFNNNIPNSTSNHSNGKKKPSSHNIKSAAPRPPPPVQSVSNNSFTADTNANLPKPDITSSVGPKLSNNIISPGGRLNGISTSLNPPLLESKMDDPGSNSNSTIDIRVQVTINTNGTPNGTTTTNGPNNNNHNNTNNNYNNGIVLGSILTSSNMNHLTYNSTPGTLADLKKQRSLQYNSIGRNSNFSLNGIIDPPPKYEPPPSPSMSLQKFSGNAAEPVGEYTENHKKCCTIV